ncbi:MAG: flagellar motor protein MotB [Methylomonas sp.]|nr:flagellar motor protein MotB [Methylomonas sp.]PPD22372.1 MAG: motility protein MotB [Methylomonas sp.]PPD26876.1 MAG: motility protein MotB [Methylomonas sp.]PPD37669.1 MAG: motility protein MotB [Methylomonas sp.]PPD38784.1 MAG: motility protein MotB [Methylomonas sp.]
MATAEQPIIIKKIKKKAGHGHHGGAWKIAYADFVTAMMAFFLLMWLLGSTDEATKKGIADYFQDPTALSLNAGEGIGDRTAIIQGGGTDLTRQDDGQVHQGEETPAEPTPEDVEKLAEEQEKIQLEKLQTKIESMLDANARLAEFRDQVKLESTPEGLKIQIIDAKNRPMFKLASAGIEDYARMIIRELAPVINELPNKITINGHTDALPFPANSSGYSNWELSSNRANVARHELTQGGLAEDKILRVVGLASSIPYNAANPNDPMNRRISIIVMNKKAENQVIHEGAAPPVAEPSLQGVSGETQKSMVITPSMPH